jgi:hypothetical protein
MAFKQPGVWYKDGKLKFIITEITMIKSEMTFSENSNYWQESLMEVIRQNIAGWCQQTLCIKKFVDNSQQCFAFTHQANFPAHNLNFHWRWRWIQAIFKIFSTLLLIFSCRSYI